MSELLEISRYGTLAINGRYVFPGISKRRRNDDGIPSKQWLQCLSEIPAPRTGTKADVDAGADAARAARTSKQQAASSKSDCRQNLSVQQSHQS